VYRCLYLHTVCFHERDTNESWTDEAASKFTELLNVSNIDEVDDKLSTFEIYLDKLLDRLATQQN
jgi:hypothetical protein